MTTYEDKFQIIYYKTYIQQKLGRYKYFFLLSYNFQHIINFSDVLQVVLKPLSDNFCTLYGLLIYTPIF